MRTAIEIDMDSIPELHDEICEAVRPVFYNKNTGEVLVYISLLLMQVETQLGKGSIPHILADIHTITIALVKNGVQFWDGPTQ